ncbi:DUF255 domain-containing protein [Profundibacter sp.]|uniref:DUF255 domain-containing protein n=1 Tax=Profundibacter sp. TaxID=3101071 RepID=UPI003D102F66
MRIFLSLLLILIASQTFAKNRLAQESSPYLQQHADNPVDWYPWGPEALEKAKAEGKMIFLSIGYASCHWCHVMEAESFEDEEIAAYLNEHFVSIKVDRERRPDLDEQFMLVTSALTGSSGWPNSVFLTPDAEPFFAGTYFPPDAFLQTLETIVDVWKTDNAALRTEAFTISQRLRDYLDQTSVLGDVTDADINAAATAMLGNLDDFNGGFGTAPKFPRENVLLFLLDQAERSGDTALMQAVTLTLDGMVRGGIHDHVGGGFHRYATDPEWNIPHFEKMLYNQALIGRILLRAYSATSNPDYARAATRTMDYILRDMRSPEGAFYAAQDADSLNAEGQDQEGAFYLWTQEQVKQTLGPEATAIIDVFNITKDGNFEGASVLHTSETPLKAISGGDGMIAQRSFRGLLGMLNNARNNRAKPLTDKKIVLPWNAEMIITLAEASRVLGRADYGEAAVQATEFMLQNMWPDDGLKRILYQGAANTNAHLVDYAALGRALLALDDYLGGADSDWLGIADKLAADMLTLFSDEGQAMRMNAQTVGLGPMRPLDDNEIASGNAQALELLAGLDRRLARTGEAAPKLAAALAVDAINAPGQRAATLVAIETQRNGLTGAMQVSNGGAVRVFASLGPKGKQLLLSVEPREGWHINAHKPLEDYLIGMELAVGETPAPLTAYPKAEIKELGFSNKPLSLYDTSFVMAAPIVKTGDKPVTVRLTLQACNDEVCLPPDDMLFRVWP